MVPRRQNPVVQLPTERIAKLKEVAATLGGATMSATVGHLLRLAEEEGLATPELPGVSIQRVQDGIEIAFGDARPAHLNYDGARSLAAAVLSCAKRSERGVRAGIQDDGFAVARRGNGILITLKSTAASKVFSRDVAEDFARVVDGAVPAAHRGGPSR